MSKKLDTMPLFPKNEAKASVSGKMADNLSTDNEAAIFWNSCLDIIRDNVSSQVFRTWFEPVKPLSWKDSQLTVQVPSQFFCEWIEEHFYPLLQKTIIQVLGENAKLQYQVVVDENSDTLDNRTIRLPAFKYPPASGNQNTLPFSEKVVVQQQEFPTFLNPRYSFENFICGESNQLAFSAAQAVGQKPGKTRFNPLFIYGDTGLGKTHIAQAIGNFITQKSKKTRVLYTTSERFTMEFINAIQNNKSNEFTNFYRSIDVLIVDDIQFFAGKEKTQDNFFHTFNALHQAGKQLVLTSDKPPKDLQDVDDRLISRFQWGLTVDVQAPDLETRMAIIQRKSEDEGMELPLDVVEFIAKNVTSSVRELEGALIGLIAKVSLDRRTLNLELAKEVVYGIGYNRSKNINIDDIKQCVADYYNLSVAEIESKVRKHEIALARQMAMYITKQLTELSLKNIGSHFSKRDHTTVLHSCQAIENYLATDKVVKASYEKLMKKLRS